MTQKAEKRVTRNGGTILKIELIDIYGTPIEGTFFNDSADYWNDKIRENAVYLMSNGQVKVANKKFSTVNNDFCIVFEKNACI